MTAEIGGFSQPSMSRIIHEVTEALCAKSNRYILMPEGDEAHRVRQGFYQIAQFPSLIGAVDGTHIRVTPPAEGERFYLNRKNFHSLNIQCICDHEMMFRDVVAKWPGASHDSFVWGFSRVKERMARGELRGTIIGDSGYPLRQYLMTPYSQTVTRAQELYNRAHKKTRVLIERAFGILKGRFLCLDKRGGQLVYTPAFAGRIFVACCILHNVARRAGLEDPDIPEVVEDVGAPHAYQDDLPEGRRRRDDLASTFLRLVYFDNYLSVA